MCIHTYIHTSNHKPNKENQENEFGDDFHSLQSEQTNFQSHIKLFLEFMKAFGAEDFLHDFHNLIHVTNFCHNLRFL